MKLFIKLSEEEQQRETLYIGGYIVGLIIGMGIYFIMPRFLNIDLFHFKNVFGILFFPTIIPYWASRFFLKRKRYAIKKPFILGFTISISFSLVNLLLVYILKN
jgi:hypothetical protein